MQSNTTSLWILSNIMNQIFQDRIWSQTDALYQVAVNITQVLLQFSNNVFLQWVALDCHGLGLSVRGPGLHVVDQMVDVSHHHNICNPPSVGFIYHFLLSYNTFFYFSVILLLIYISSLYLYIYKAHRKRLIRRLTEYVEQGDFWLGGQIWI